MSNGDVPPLNRSSRLSRLTHLSRHSSKKNKDKNHQNDQQISSPTNTIPEDDQQDEQQKAATSPRDSGLASENGDNNNDGELLLGSSNVNDEVRKELDHESNGNTQPSGNVGADGAEEGPVEASSQRIDKDEPTSPDGTDDEESYDLKPPPPRAPSFNVEATVARYYSADHLDLIIRDPLHAAHFRHFLETYRPEHGKVLERYIQSRKAFAAIEYANAIAQQMPRATNTEPFVAASFDDDFGTNLREAAETLIDDTLPAYLTHRLVTIVTESLVKDIMGTNTPFMKALIPNLAEVYCISDPSVEDNPVVYASEEFFNTTQYNPDYALGRNCRFLQGPESPRKMVTRLKEAIKTGEEICETLLNYRRDGSPFVNLLMIAPLYDNKGDVRYFLGCQIDVTPMLEEGKGLDSFAELLAQDASSGQDNNGSERDSSHLLGEFAEMLSDSEAISVKDKLRLDGQMTQPRKRPNTRRVLSSDDDPTGAQSISGTLWPAENLGHSGRLPGVYRNYLLVRPYPSLRITFTSPALRIPGLLQTKFLDRIGGPEQTRKGLVDALASGTSVTAKVSWLPNASDKEDNQYVSGEGKPRWIHCTPLLGSDNKVGVWMIVVVAEEEVTGILNRADSQRSAQSASRSRSAANGRRSPGNELYADYLKEGNSRPQTSQSQRTN